MDHKRWVYYILGVFGVVVVLGLIGAWVWRRNQTTQAVTAFSVGGPDCTLTIQGGQLVQNDCPPLPGTPTPGEPTAEPTITQQPSSTPTVTSTPFQEPTATRTRQPSTPQPTPTQPGPTPTPHEGECPPHGNEWHAPMADPCFNDNHGIDPLSDEVKAIFDGETMPDGSVFSIEAHLEKYGELLQPLYVSSPTEDVRGAIWLKFSDYTCPRNPDSDFDFSGYGCITDVLVRIHDPFGKLSHFIVRKHSESFIIKACELGEDGLPVFEDETDEDTCGLFILPGRLTDYGVAHAQYKQVACHLPGEPGGLYPDDKIDQPPYRATSANGSQYWVATSPNPIVSAFYDNVNEFPDNFAWNSVDPFFAWPQLGRGDPDVSMCGIDRNFADVQAELDSAGVLIPGNEHKIFQLVDLRLGPIPGVGTFWYDVFGNQLPPGMCTDANSICVPYTFSEGFPAFAAINYDATDRNDCDLIPCFIADDGGLELLPPDDGLVH